MPPQATTSCGRPEVRFVRFYKSANTEATNAKIQWIKRLGCGYRNRERFRNAIYFHLGGLDLYPDAVATHTNS